MSTRYATLVASTVRNVSVSHGDPYTDVIADAPDRVLVPGMDTLEVINVDGDDIVYFTYAFGSGFEGAASAGLLPATPTIGGDGTTVVPAVAGAFVRIDAPPERNLAVVRAISAGTPRIGISSLAPGGTRGVDGEAAAPGGGVVDHAQTVVSGDVSALTTSWATLTGYEVTVDASAGDVVDLMLATYANAFVSSGQVALDIGTVVSAAVVNRISGGTGNSDHGCLEAFVVNTVKGTGIARRYTVQAGDISGGQVLFRGLYRNPTGSCTLTAGTNFRSLIQATNLGQ